MGFGPRPACRTLPPAVTYRYKPEILEQLAAYGVFPKAHTRPELVHEFIKDLYRFELRLLRDRLVRKEIPKVGYYDRVVEMRRKYPVVSLKPQQLVEV